MPAPISFKGFPNPTATLGAAGAVAAGAIATALPHRPPHRATGAAAATAAMEVDPLLHVENRYVHQQAYIVQAEMQLI